MWYRKSRAIEASTIQEIEQILTDASWSNVNVELGFGRVYNLEPPIVTVRVEDTFHTKVEIGTNSTRREVLIFIDIFAKSDEQREDLKDTLIDELKHGWDYYEYEIENGEIKTKTETGRLSVRTITDTPVNFDIDKSSLDKRDRFRWLITLRMALNKVEE